MSNPDLALLRPVNARLVWAFTCPECGVVNLMTETPEPDLEVSCGTGYVGESAGPFSGCGTIFKIGIVYDQQAILAVHREVEYKTVEVALADA